MIHLSLILHHNMGMKYAEEPFNMGMFFYLRRPSKWVHFPTLNTHIRAFLYWSRPPGKPPSQPGPRTMDYDHTEMNMSHTLFFWSSLDYSIESIVSCFIVTECQGFLFTSEFAGLFKGNKFLIVFQPAERENAFLGFGILGFNFIFSGS